MKKLIITSWLIVFAAITFGMSVDRVEPRFWWVGMKNPNLQLMIHGEGLAGSHVLVDYPGVSLKSVTQVENPNYLFIDLKISDEAKPGTFQITFTQSKRDRVAYSYELKARTNGSETRMGFNSSDVIY
nr:cyclomaltodextrinase N-terminal domain-containing protein [Sunxiuqinia sp.]